MCERRKRINEQEEKCDMRNGYKFIWKYVFSAGIHAPPPLV